MSWLAKSKELVSRPESLTCPPLDRAWELVAQGEYLSAAAEARSLTEPQQYFLSYLLAVQAARQGAGPEVLGEMMTLLMDMPAGALDSSWLPAVLEADWVREVGHALPPATVARCDEHRYGQPMLVECIRHLCAVGRHADAVPFAELLNPHWRVDVATSWGMIGSGLQGADKASAWTKAAKAGITRDLIEEGGEEAEALGVAMRFFADGGAKASDPFVRKAHDQLISLGRHLAPKDVKAYGTVMAGVAAAKAAALHKDSEWLSLAAQLHDRLWGEEGKRQVMAAMRLARQAMGMEPAEDAEELQRIMEDKPPLLQDPQHLALLIAQGQDVQEHADAYIRGKDASGVPDAAMIRRACAVGLTLEQMEPMLQRIHARDKPFAQAHLIEMGFGTPQQRAQWLEESYLMLLPYTHLGSTLWQVLSPEMVLKAESHFTGEQDLNALMALAVYHWQRGDQSAVSRCVARFSIPPVEPWVPMYRRGGRARQYELQALAPQPLSDADVELQLTQADRPLALLKLARAVKGNPAQLGKVAKASQLPLFLDPYCNHQLMEIRLIAGLLPDAYALLATCKGDALHAALRLLAEHCTVHSQAPPSGYAALAMEALRKLHAQDAAPLFCVVGRVLVSSAPEGGRKEVISQLREASTGQFKQPGDQAYLWMGVALGLWDAGDPKAAQAAAGKALAALPQKDFYFEYAQPLPALAEMLSRFPPGEKLAAASRAYQAVVAKADAEHKMLMRTELFTRHLWSQREAAMVNAVFQSGVLPQALMAKWSRSLWADIAQCPGPLQALEATWPTQALPTPVARELLQALADALRWECHAEADAVAAFVKGLEG